MNSSLLSIELDFLDLTDLLNELIILSSIEDNFLLICFLNVKSDTFN